jgi:transposase InsO family protein
LLIFGRRPGGPARLANVSNFANHQVADITFVPTLAGFLFLAVVMDAWSRRIVGWAFSADLKTRTL